MNESMATATLQLMHFRNGKRHRSWPNLEALSHRPEGEASTVG